MAKKWYRADGTFSTLQKNGVSRAFVKGELYKIDLLHLHNPQIRKSFTLADDINEDGVVERATAAPGEKRSTKKKPVKK